MTSRLEELFSPDRLRRNWQIEAAPVPEPARNQANLKIHAKFGELQGLIRERFQDVSRLSGQFDELTEIINQTYPLDATTDSVDVKQKETIVVMLEQLETLIWAMELAKRDAG